MKLRMFGLDTLQLDSNFLFSSNVCAWEREREGGGWGREGERGLNINILLSTIYIMLRDKSQMKDNNLWRQN